MPSRVPRDDELAELVNRFLLEPLERKRVETDRNDANWRNAKKVSGRLDLCNYLLQEIKDRDNLFEERLSTAP
jgi:hypothetical protein